MRKSLWIMFAVMVVAIAAPIAHADSFTDGTLNFVTTSGFIIPGEPTGSFVFDNTTNVFTTFTVSWDDGTFDFGPSGGGITLAGLGSSGKWCAASSSEIFVSCPAGSFDLNGFTIMSSTAFIADPAGASGTYTVKETAVGAPEPSSLALVPLGLVALLLVRKRTSHPSAA